MNKLVKLSLAACLILNTTTLLAQVDNLEQVNNEEEFSPDIVDKVLKELEKNGIFYAKTAGRFEITKKLPEKAETIDEMFNYADAYGNIRLAYIDSAHKISTSPKVKKKAGAIGGEIGINTATYNGIGFRITSYISQNLEFANPNKNDINEDFFNTDRDSFTYISEASINYSNDFVYSKLGRIKVETPYANSDDIRMAANTFEDAGLSQDTFKT